MKWDVFRKKYNVRQTEKCCYTCKHGKVEYEGKCKCKHPLVKGERLTSTGWDSVCDLWNVGCGYSGTLEEVIKQFCDEKWGMSPGETTASRFAKDLEWFRGMVKEYAEFFGKTEDEMVAEMEAERNYSWPNFYQPVNFPSLKNVKGDPHFVGLFKTRDDFAKHCRENYVGFRCPKCGNVGKEPQKCDNGTGGGCGWCATGLFESPWFVMIPELGYKKIAIFEPVKKE